MDATVLLTVMVASLFRNAVPEFIEPIKVTNYVAVGESAKFSFRFTGGFDQIDFGPLESGVIKIIAIKVTMGTPLKVGSPPTYQGRISWAGNENVSPVEAVFILSNVSQGDAGKYSCRVYQDGAEKLKTVELIVTDANILEHPKSAVCQTFGGEVNFTCNATGTPQPNVTWVKGEEEIGESNLVKIVRDGKGYSKLTIKNCGREDVLARYRCKATNPPNVEVLSKPSILFFDFIANDTAEVAKYSSPSVVTGSIGMETTLRCAFRSYPPPSVNWTLPNGNSTRTYLPFLSIKPKSGEQFGQYTCNAEGFTLRTITLKGKATGNDTITTLPPGPRVFVNLGPVDDTIKYKVAVTRQGSPNSFFAITSSKTNELVMDWASEVSNIEKREETFEYWLDVRFQTASSNYVFSRYHVKLVSKAILLQAGFLAVFVPVAVVLLSAGFQ